MPQRLIRWATQKLLAAALGAIGKLESIGFMSTMSA
jgi:hypothetical protein